MRGIRFVPENTNINFIGVRLLAFMLSGALLLGSIGLLSMQGLSFGIDFTGGTLIEIRVQDESKADITDFRGRLNNLGLGSVSIQEFGQPQDFLIRVPQQDGDDAAQQVAIDKVRAELSDGIDYRRVEYVGPQVGGELIRAGIMAVLFSVAGILVYIWVRFEWQFGLAAVIALTHDMLLVLGIFSFTEMEFNLSTVAAVLMIAGYSINDTVVVFDRVRENLRKFKKKPLQDIANLSINQTLARTLLTSLTTLLALFALWLFGGEVIRGFVDALIWGILIGTYSSIFVATPVLLYMNVRRSTVDSSGEGEEAQAHS